MKALSVRNLSFSYDKHLILNNVNLDINDNKFVALIGPNGAGKSTFFKLLLGKLLPNNGEIYIYGDSINNNNHYNDIAYISQNSILQYKNFPTTVYECIETHLKYLKSKETVDYYLELLHLKNHKNNMLRQLSGGQLQRVALALALLKKAKLIILDEPTSGIDKEFTEELYEMLKKITNDNKTVIMATHDLVTSSKYVDEVLCIEDSNCYILSNSEIEREINSKHGHGNIRNI